MDPKILAAVFASIAALTVSGSGSVDDFQNFDPGKFLDGNLGELPIDMDSLVGQITDRPEPENSIQVTATVNSREASLSAENAVLEIEAFESLRSESRVIESDQRISFRNFNGEILLSKNSSTGLKGDSTGFSSSGVNITEKMKIDYDTNASRILLSDVQRSKISLDDVDVEMSSEEGTELSQSDSPMSMNSFSGDITVLPAENTIRFEGLVDRFEAGGASFSG